MTMPKLTIDGRSVEVAEGATVLEAARALGIDIPSLCHHPDYEPNTSCMACVVRVEGVPRLVPSCATPAAEGMRVESETEEVRAARRTSIELLLSDHAGDCVAPCQRADEHHLDVPRFLRRVGEGDVEGAAAILEAAGLRLDDAADVDLTRAQKACRRGRHDETVALEDLVRYVAAARDRYGGPGTPPPPYREFTVGTARLDSAQLEELIAGASSAPPVSPADPEAGFTAEEAGAEALRCLHCDCRQASSCTLRNAGEAYGARKDRFRVPRPPLEQDHSHPEILHEPGKCIRCGLCLQVAERAGERLGLAFVGRGFDMRVKVPFDAPLAEALEKAAGTCADVCPTGALVRIRCT